MLFSNVLQLSHKDHKNNTNHNAHTPPHKFAY